jgi:esterase/lipase superfamily enzyme
VPRVGAAPLEELEEFGVTVIDLSAISNSSSGTHSKFAGSPEVVQLIGVGLNSAGRFDEDTSPVIDQILTVSPIRILRNAASGGSRN